MASKPHYSAKIPVLCVGNLVAGGAGKTPTAIALANVATNLGLKPGFLSRGYGGHVNAPTVVNEHHNARDVGDEPLLLARCCMTVVSPDRVKGARLLEDQGVDIIIMDDGFQNPALHKDYNLVVIDSERGIGNGFAMPGGPLRANLEAQLAHASAILVIGADSAADSAIRAAARRAKPLFEAKLVPVEPCQWESRRFLAFAGIANPQKFFTSLRKASAMVSQERRFGDHHQLSSEEVEEILQTAQRDDLEIITTSKDAVRLGGQGNRHKELAQRASVFEIELQFDNERIIKSVIKEAVRQAKSRQLGQKRR